MEANPMMISHHLTHEGDEIKYWFEAPAWAGVETTQTKWHIEIKIQDLVLIKEVTLKGGKSFRKEYRGLEIIAHTVTQESENETR